MDIIKEAEILIANPVYMGMIPDSYKAVFIPMPYFGLSGRVFANWEYDYIGIKGFNY